MHKRHPFLHNPCFNPRSPCGERHDDRPQPPYISLVSTHAPHAGSDAQRLGKVEFILKFQPTLPMRGATRWMLRTRAMIGVSTHAPHAGSDAQSTDVYLSNEMFQPTLPMRGATLYLGIKRLMFGVSTHAPHAGSDVKSKGIFAVF